MDVSMIVGDKSLSTDSGVHLYRDDSTALVSLHQAHGTLSVHVRDAAQADRLAALFSEAARLLRAVDAAMISPPQAGADLAPINR